MAVVYRNQRKLGKIWPNSCGAIIAATNGGKRLGVFTHLAIEALLDIADKPIEAEIWIEWVEVIAESLSPDSNASTEPELVEQPPVRKAMEMLLNPW